MPRLKYASVVRGVVILALFCLWLQIILSAGSGNGGTGYRDGGFEFTHDPIKLKGLLIKKHTTVYEEELMNANDTSEHVLALVPPELHKYLTVHPKILAQTQQSAQRRRTRATY
ncbi:uncharacterized protein LOC119190479 isoform X1 [Manduca sexta]|uniref:uncharacterized protein LOC119190479 isoform X1 n=1 Tax=Manduca sexta TaxID=7130 RepID=UPI001890A4FB|nr:uncharacterized protein LOC119190479 isoform X1 [Manduca sexta]